MRYVLSVLIIMSTFSNFYSILVAVLRGKMVKRILMRQGNILMEGDFSVQNLLGFADLLRSGWVVERASSNFLTVRFNSIKIKCRTTKGADFGHLSEIFLQQIYGTDFGEETVVDIGASNGDSTIYFCLNGAKRVICVEPDADSLELARINILANNLMGRVTLENSSLSSETGWAAFYTSESFPNSNSLSPTRTMTSVVRYNGKRKVQTLSLSDLFARFALTYVDFLKIDCEGCEYAAIEKGLSALARVGRLVVEFHEGPQRLPLILRQNGFRVKTRGSPLGTLWATRERSGVPTRIELT
jgi:FkbM family methyltransferase